MKHHLSAITLVIPTLCCGGAERTITTMANWWAERGTMVSIIGFDLSAPAYPLDARVSRCSLNTLSPLQGTVDEWPEESGNILRLRHALLLCLEKAPIRPLPVISFLSRMNIRTLLAAATLPCRVIVSERAYPPATELSLEVERLRRQVYQNAFHVVFQTDRSKTFWGQEELGLAKAACIPNAAPQALAPPPKLPGIPPRFILGAGRLTPEKQFDVLITTFAAITKQFPNVHLVIGGEGPLRRQLEEQTSKILLSNIVHFPGIIHDIQAWATHAIAFVLTSAFEGFPNVLLESMAAGCPCIAFDCPTGPREIIRNGIDGILVPDQDISALTHAITTLISYPLLRNKLGDSARDVCARFDIHSIMTQWESLFA